jgi:pheromone shutdown protein TraB
MTKDEAMEIITFSPQCLELMSALEEAKKQLSPEVSQALMNEVDKFVTQQIAELSELVEGNTFRA